MKTLARLEPTTFQLLFKDVTHLATAFQITIRKANKSLLLEVVDRNNFAAKFYYVTCKILFALFSRFQSQMRGKERWAPILVSLESPYIPVH